MKKEDNLAYKISFSLGVLGLRPGADAGQIRSAFRRLARSCHPDIAGAGSAQKFEQISCAYSLLKGLSKEELSLADCDTIDETAAGSSGIGGWWGSFVNGVHVRKEEREKKKRAEQAAHEEAERNRKIARDQRILSTIDTAVRRVNVILERRERQQHTSEIENVCIRLLASRHEVRLLALSRVSHFCRDRRVCDTILQMLKTRPFDGETLSALLTLSLGRDMFLKVINTVVDTKNFFSLSDEELMPFVSRMMFIIGDDSDMIKKLMRHSSPRILELAMRHWLPVDELPPQYALESALADSCDEKTATAALLTISRCSHRAYTDWVKQRIAVLRGSENQTIRLWANRIPL